MAADGFFLRRLVVQIAMRKNDSSGDPGLILTRKEVADYLRVCLRTVDKMIQSGLLPHVRIGRKVIFRREAVDCLLKRLEVGIPL